MDPVAEIDPGDLINSDVRVTAGEIFGGSIWTSVWFVIGQCSAWSHLHMSLIIEV